jgi:hypothetical protein
MTHQCGITDLPPIYVSKNFICFLLAMLRSYVVHNPGNQMVLKCTFDDLVQKVRRQQLMDVGPRKMGCEWLIVYAY